MDGRRPDLIVLDIAMPGTNGIEVLGRINSREPTIPVVLHTAYTSYRNNFMTWLADAYVVKSSDLTEFISTVHALLHDIDDVPGQGAIAVPIGETSRGPGSKTEKETRHHESSGIGHWPGS